MRTKNKELLNNIISYINEKRLEENYCPTIQEIADKFGIAKSTAHDYLSELETNGLLNRTRRTMSTSTTKKVMSSVVNVPVVGDIACGTPILAEENIDNYVCMSKGFLGEGKFFALRAKGKSMIDANIDDGDIVIVRQQDTAEEGQIVVALINDEATLKRYYFDKKRKQVRLHPENVTLNDLYYDSVNIQGIAIKVVKELN